MKFSKWRNRRVLALALMLALTGLCNSAEVSERLKLKNMAMAQTEHGRELLKYLVSCALQPNVSVSFDAAGQSFEYPGSLGLVPQWSHRSLTLEEEQIISACILARTNYFGKTVKLSMRNESLPALQPDESELRDFPFFEASFFGNIFKAEPEHFVCIGEAKADREKRLEALLRVCSLGPANSPSLSMDLATLVDSRYL
jgi:hypothetical protein